VLLITPRPNGVPFSIKRGELRRTIGLTIEQLGGASARVTPYLIQRLGLAEGAPAPCSALPHVENELERRKRA
jgi:hypothetical protein